MFKKYKYVYALLIMLLFLMVITAASASDINQTNDVDLSASSDVIVDTVSANENDAYTNLEDSTRVLDENLKSSDEIYVNSSITENGDGSKDNPFKDMKSAINKSENGSTIYIAPGTYSGLNNTNLTITNSLNIMNWTNGDVIFDGEQKNWIFRIFNNINIQGITFINSNDSAIYISKGNSAISNSIFANNSAKYSQSWGGAIFIDNSNFTIFNCSFVNNSAKYEEAEGGAIFIDNSNSTVFNCSFVNNYAKEYGGAIYIYYGNSTVSNCSFVNNSARQGMGGAIDAWNSIISNCSFVNNSAKELEGGAIGARNSTISNCSFVNNSAYYGGGAIVASNSIISNCTFINNTGGAIYSGYSTISNCSFVSNSNNNGAGAIYSYKSNLTIFNCSFVDNSAEVFGGAIYSINSNFTIFNSSFMNNKATNGSAIYVRNINYTISSADGETVYIEGGDSIVSNCSFVNNSANYGGAIYNKDGSCSVVNCSFVNNSAKWDGGAFYSINGTSTVSICSFVNNTACLGSAIRMSDDNSEVSICTFSYNDGGGAISVDGCNSIVSNCIFTNNIINEGGSAIITWEDNSTIFNCTFVNNIVKYRGGAIHIWGGNPTVSYCYFVNNTVANHGGAIYISVCNNPTVSNCNFINNTVGEYGGAIYSDNSNSTFSNCNFMNNNVTSIYIRDYDKTNHIILNNNSLNGGLIYNNGTIISSTSIVVLENKTLNSFNNQTTLNATIYDDNGNIIVCDDFNFTINNKTIKGTLENDTFKANAVLGEGTNIIGAVAINGTLSNNTVKTAVINFKEADIIIIAPNVTKYYNGTERFRVQITDKNGTPLNNTAVTITINGRPYDRTTNEFGNTSIPLGLTGGVYDVITNCSDYAVESTVTIMSTIIANDFTKIFKNGTQYLATFLDKEGKLLKEGKATFNINGIFYNRTINDAGVAKLNINLPPGEYTITAINPVTNEKHANIITVLTCIDENYNITKYFKNDTQYSVRALDANGNPVGAGVLVQFNINGRFYNRTTNASGHAKLNINLPAGDYVISAIYNGLTVSNNITVLSTLIASDLDMDYRDGSRFGVRLVDNQGNIIAGQSVNFNINGRFYDRTTDANGYAWLNINLPEGVYIITSKYVDSVISNTITIYPENSPGKR